MSRAPANASSAMATSPFLTTEIRQGKEPVASDRSQTFPEPLPHDLRSSHTASARNCVWGRCMVIRHRASIRCRAVASTAMNRANVWTPGGPANPWSVIELTSRNSMSGIDAALVSSRALVGEGDGRNAVAMADDSSTVPTIPRSSSD
jgi:hypothetical protein